MKVLIIIITLTIGFTCLGQAPQDKRETAEAMLNSNPSLEAKELWITTEADITKSQSIELRSYFFEKEGSYEVEYDGREIYFRYVSALDENAIYAILAKVKADAEIREPVTINF